MSYPTTAPVVTTQIPLKGMNRKDPYAAMDPNYGTWIRDFIAEAGYFRMRHGFVIHCVPVDSPALIESLGTWGSKLNTTTNKLFAYCSGEAAHTNTIYDVSTSTPALESTLATATCDTVAPVKFRKYTAFFGDDDWAASNVIYNGSNFTTVPYGYTYGGDSIGSHVACSFKGRVYMFSGTSCYYSGLASYTGATSLFDVADFLEDGGNIVWCGVLSPPGDRTDEIMLAFGNSAGEILVYSGDYPASATWSIARRFRTSPPLGPNSVVSFRNDIWIMTMTGVVSLRDLFTKGSVAAEDQTVSWAIDPYWQGLTARLTAQWTNPVTSAYWPEQNKIFILMPGYINESGNYTGLSATMFVYNCLTQAWTILNLPGMPGASTGNLTYYKNNLYFSVSNVIMTFGSGYKDESYLSPGTYAGINAIMWGAYSNYGSAGKNKTLIGFEPIINTDLAGVTVAGVGGVSMSASIDMGKGQTGSSEVPLVSGYNIPFYKVGGNGCYFQWQMGATSETTDTIGLELYSMGVSISE